MNISSKRKSIEGDISKWLVLGTVMLGLFMAVLDSNIVNVALPHMITAFSTNSDRIRWVLESYTMTYAVFTLTTSWLRERVSIKYSFFIGLLIFTLSSVLCGISWSMGSMIVFRIMQGIGGGIMMPTGMTLITESFPPQQRGTAFGIFGIVIVFAPSIGPTLGGYIVDSVNWRYIFYINLPVGILTLFMTLTQVKETKKLVPKPFDFWGFVSLSAFLGCLLVALTDGQSKGWRSDEILSYFAVSALGLIAFLLISKRTKHPIIDIGIFRNFYFSILCILNVARAFALFGRFFLMPLFFQNLIGYSAMSAGILLMPGAIVSGIIMPIIGPLIDRYGPKFFLVSGFALMGISLIMYRNIDVTTPYVFLLIPILIFGVGTALSNTPLSATAMNVVRREQIGQVSTLLSVVMQVGGSFGVAMLGMFTTNRTIFHQARISERLTSYSYAGQVALQGIQTLGRQIGESAYLAKQQAPVILSAYIAKQSQIAGFQDAFFITGILCFASLLPMLGLINLKHPRYIGAKKTQVEASIDAGA